MEFVFIASAHFMALLSPGPDFFLIMQTALRLKLRYAFAVCAGIATANGVYIMLAVTGLEAVKQMETLMLFLQYGGSAYLVYLGILLLRAPMRPLDPEETAGVLHVRNLKRQFTIGFMSGILNPKNAIFYLSLFTVMVSPRTSLPVRSLYGCWMVGVVLTWDMGIALLIGHRRVKNLLSSWLFRIEKFSGVMLTCFGILLAIK
ncbi:MAG TPA: LysE family translocator [Desulfobulbus sp.]|nr:LysE family translocator [Desulfobulbus sp.]